MIPSRRRVLLLAVVGCSGAAVLVLEMAAPRLFAPFYGTSQPVWTNVIGVVLAALAAGYALGGRWARRGPSLRAPGIVLMAAGVLGIVASRWGPSFAAWLLPSSTDLEGVTTLLVQGSLVATLCVFGPPMVLLGMVTPLVIQALGSGEDAGDASGRVLGVSTVGSLLGTFLTTHWFLDQFGTRATVAGAGVALMICGLALVALGGAARTALTTATLVALASTAAAAAPRGHFRPAEAASGAVVLAEYDTACQFLQVRGVEETGPDGKPVRTRLLTMNEGVGTYHSVLREGSVLTGGRYYDLYPTLPLLAGAKPGDKVRVAILGMAAGTQARAMHHFMGADFDLHIDGVEIDAAAVEAGHRWFDLPREAPWLTVHLLDARAFLAASAEDTFDLLLVDCFSQEYYLPFHLTTEEFFRLARSRLRPGGLLAYNAFAYRPDDPLLRALTGATANAFGRVWTIPVTGYPNHVVLAWKDDACFDGKGVHLPLERFARLCEDAREGGYAAVAARPEGAEALRFAAAAARDAVPVEPPVDAVALLDDRAPVERLADEAQGELDALRRGTPR